MINLTCNKRGFAERWQSVQRLKMKFILLVHIVLLSMQFLGRVSTSRESVKDVSLFISGIQPRRNDAYLCRAFKLTPDHEDDHQWLINVKQVIENGSAHHVDIFNCAKPGYLAKYPTMEHSDDIIWDCGHNVSSGIPGIIEAEMCDGPVDDYSVIPFEFDQKKISEEYGIGIKVGPKSQFKYLVVEVHYGDPKDATVDSKAGFDVKILSSKNSTRLKSAGMHIHGSLAGTIPRHSMGYFDTACRYEFPQALNLISFRSHTHHLGRIVSGFKIKNGDEYQLLGKQFPQNVRSFHPLEQSVVRIEMGDIIASRCVFNNTMDHDVQISVGHHDEMCYFYVVYYVDTNESLPYPFKACYVASDDYYWETDPRLSRVFEKIDHLSKQLAPSNSSSLDTECKHVNW